MKPFTLSIVGALRGLVVVGCLLAPSLALAQRVQFPTMVEQGAVSGADNRSAGMDHAADFWNTGRRACRGDPADVRSLCGAAIVSGACALFTLRALALRPGPDGALHGPLCRPLCRAPGALYPQGLEPMPIMPQGTTFGQPLRFLQDLRLRWTWLAPMGSDSLGVNDLQTGASFALPFFKTSSPLVITPGFGMQFWQGPVTQSPTFADLPARTYDAYLDSAWYPTITPWLMPKSAFVSAPTPTSTPSARTAFVTWAAAWAS